MTRGFLTEWDLDGTVGLIFSLVTVAIGIAYVIAAEIGRRRDRRSRRWPLQRTGCFIAGLVVLLVALDSGIGGGADEYLSAHMVEHMLIWLLAAPLLVAAAPVRLAFFALGRRGRRRLGRVLRSRAVVALTGPALSGALFSAVIVISHLPLIYDVTLEVPLVHVLEHAVYLLTSALVWAPLIGADPIPHHLNASRRIACVTVCMIPMAAISFWLLLSPTPLYGPYQLALGPMAALSDQRLAGLIMLAASAPALAIALVARPISSRTATTMA
jgi:cytochrome c oxidase assembly factor CtaG